MSNGGLQRGYYQQRSSLPSPPSLIEATSAFRVSSLRLLPDAQSLTHAKSCSAAQAKKSMRRLHSIDEKDLVIGGATKSGFDGIRSSLLSYELAICKNKYLNNEIYARLLPKCQCTACDQSDGDTQHIMPMLLGSTSLETGTKFHSQFKRRSTSSTQSLYERPSLISHQSYALLVTRVSSLDSADSTVTTLGSDCMKETNIPLIEVMEIGKRESHKHLMHVLNDINCRLILENKANLSFNSSNNMMPIFAIQQIAKIRSLSGAFSTYHSRLAGPLDFSPRYMINDDINEIIQIIKIMTHVVQSLYDKNGMPLHVDLMIIPRKSEPTHKESVVDQEEDNNVKTDSDSDDESDSDKEDFNEDIQRKSNGQDMEQIGDIGVMLKDGLSEDHQDRFYRKRVSLNANQSGIKAFIQMIKHGKIDIFGAKKSTQKGRYVFIADRRQNDDERMFESETPIMTDMEDEKGDDCMGDMYFFQPPEPYGNMENHNKMIEVLHLNTLQCLLPIKSNHKVTRKENENFIGAKELCHGEIVISFHILSEEKKRCYLYIDGRYMRINLVNDNDGQELRELLKIYTQSDKCNDNEMESKIKSSKYGKFAFETKDTQFEKHWEWIKEKIDTKDETALSIGSLHGFNTSGSDHL